jgi:hypothetical protein
MQHARERTVLAADGHTTLERRGADVELGVPAQERSIPEWVAYFDPGCQGLVRWRPDEWRRRSVRQSG